MGISKKLIDERECEDYLEELIYLQAIEWEWQQWEEQEIMKEKGRIHTELIPKEDTHDKSNSEYQPLYFPEIDD